MANINLTQDSTARNAPLRRYSEVEDTIHPITRKALAEYVRRVVAYEKDNLLQIILFGSVARGTATPDSDIDVLVLLKEKRKTDEREIAGITVDVEWDLDFDANAYIMPIVMSASHIVNSALEKNISRDGVVLHERVAC